MANRNTFPGLEIANPIGGRIANAVAGATSGEWIIPIHDTDNLDFEISTTGTLTGTFALLICSSRRISQGLQAPTVVQAGNVWTDISTTPSTYPVAKIWGAQPAGGVGALRICAFQVPSGWAKIAWTAVSGTGNITIYANAKGF